MKLSLAVKALESLLEQVPPSETHRTKIDQSLADIHHRSNAFHFALMQANVVLPDTLATRLFALQQLHIAVESSYEPSRLELTAVLRLAAESISELDEALRTIEDTSIKAALIVMKSHSAARKASALVDLMMHALPPQHRSRYREEIRAELYELAQAKATGSMQIYYTLRQLTRILALRRTLKDPAAQALEPLIRATHWALSSEIRTWLIIGAVTLSALIDVVVEQGWGSALLAVPAAWAFHQGACWLRKKLGISVISGRREDGEGSPPHG